MKRKHLMEVSLNSYTTWGALLQQGDFAHLQIPEGEMPQIYLICRRQKISYDPASIKETGDTYTGKFNYKDSENTYEQSFTFPKTFSDGTRLNFDLKFPYTHIQATYKTGEVINGNVANFATISGSVPEQFLDLEILYIGQSASDSNEYGIVDRLKSHSTLQSIYAEAIRNFPDQDIWIALFHFNCQQMSMFNGPALVDGKITPESFEYDVDVEYDDEAVRLAKITDSVDIDQQFINFTEAALIRHFEPEYNQKFKKTFPSPVHSSYASCYELDIHSISVAFLTDTIQSRVYTTKVKPSQEHGINFPFHSAEDRKNIFDLL